MARYAFVGDPQELARMAEAEIVPALQAQPGFKGYSLTDSNGEIISFSIWETAEQAEEASTAIANWVTSRIGDRVALKETRLGEVLLSTALGVHATAGVSA
jgi:hypothetical protein